MNASFKFLLTVAVIVSSARINVAQTSLTIEATTHRSIGGVSQLDRPRFFNHWGTHTSGMGALADVLTSESGLNSVTGRETFEFDGLIANGLSEDPSNPGFFRQSDLVSRLQGSYKNWILSNSRWDSLREHPDPIFVQSGRAQGAWPAWIRDGSNMPMKGNGAAYADFLNVYLEEVLYGTGAGQGYLPFAPERFFLEIMNEPQLELGPGGVDWDDVIQMHKTVTETVKAQYPQANIGGASVGDQLAGPHNWGLMKDLMDDMTTWSAEFDFWSIHPYECYRVNNSGNNTRLTLHSPSHLNALMDLFESYSNILFGEPKQFAVTEYGCWATSNLGTDNFGNFTLAQRQWYLARDTKEKLMVFLNRPDRIINATPFIAPQWWTESSPTEENGFYTFWHKNSSGNFEETISGGMFRMYNDVKGDFVGVGDDDINLQSIAFRDGDTVYVLLNNMKTSSNVVNVSVDTGTSSVLSASLDRVYWDGSQGVYEEDVDVSSSWESLTMLADEGAVLKLTLDGAVDYQKTTEETTYYGDQTQVAIGSGGVSGTVVIPNLVLSDIDSAKMRIAYTRTSGTQGEGFVVNVNGNPVTVLATGIVGYDDSDHLMLTREVNVPTNFLQNGNNSVFVDFNSSGGQLLAATLIGTKETSLADPEVLLGDSLFVTRGTLAAGSLESLELSDNVDLSISRNVTDVISRTEFEIENFSPYAALSGIDVRLEGSVFARTGVEQAIDMYNYNTNEWEEVDTRDATRFVDSTTEFSLTGDVNRFIQPVTARLLARVRYRSANPRQRFTSNTDQFYWTIQP